MVCGDLLMNQFNGVFINWGSFSPVVEDLTPYRKQKPAIEDIAATDESFLHLRNSELQSMVQQIYYINLAMNTA
jgi:hypothetical protein